VAETRLALSSSVIVTPDASHEAGESQKGKGETLCQYFAGLSLSMA